jgi:hypothetical protein
LVVPTKEEAVKLQQKKGEAEEKAKSDREAPTASSGMRWHLEGKRKSNKTKQKWPNLANR